MITKQDEATLYSFRVNLLKTILLITFFVSLFIGMMGLIDLFSFPKSYLKLLLLYSVSNLLAYLILRYKDGYFIAMNLAILSAIATFSVMSYTVINASTGVRVDELRLVWFFFVVFAAFMFGGKPYGLLVTSLIVLIVVTLALLSKTENISSYSLFTFVTAIMIFSFFVYAFLSKLEKDEQTFHARIQEEIATRQNQEQMFLRQHRMIKMGEMIDAIAHQWRQPLTQSNMILLNLYETLDDVQYDTSYREKKLEELMQLTEHMSQTIDDFRYLLTDSKEMNSFSIEKSINEVKALMKNNLRDVEFISNIEDVTIFGFKNEFVQFLVTILHNATEIMSEKDIRHKKIYLSVKQEKEHARIDIEDNAQGIKDTNIDKVFDPYFTTKKQKGGTGLGLYITKIMIEENMHGSITVQNGQHGAHFTIRLPLHG